MENFITIDYLGTLAGVTVIVTLLTQFTKELIDTKLKKIPTKFVAFFYALVTILVYQLVTGTFKWNMIYVTIINSIIVTLTAQGGYEWIFKARPPTTDITNQDINK